MVPNGSLCVAQSILLADCDGNDAQENHENNSNIVIDQVELGHTVNVFNCKSSVIQVVGKVNAVSLGA